jgi:hypothetical protein
MADIQSVNIGGEVYNVAQAPAKQQKTLLTLVGAICAGNSAAAQVEEISIDFLKGVLLVIGEDKLDKISNIVLPRVFKEGESVCVDIESFKGSMNTYLTLVANAIKINLQDFFTWLDSENKSARDKSGSKKKVG